MIKDFGGKITSIACGKKFPRKISYNKAGVTPCASTTCFRFLVGEKVKMVALVTAMKKMPGSPNASNISK
jgi:hypothetical protein